MTDWTRIRVEYLGERSQSILPPGIKMPMLPRAVMRFARESEQPDANAVKLGRIIETDAGLTAELLKYVNSAAFGLQSKAVSAQHAVGMLGVKASKLFLLTTAVRNAMRSTESKLINLQSFAATNLERALFARDVARQLRTDGELAFAAAMLQDFLLPLLTNERIDDYFEFIKRQRDTPTSFTKFETTVFGWDHAEAAANVMFDWGFPDDLVCCVLFHHRGLKLLADDRLGRTTAAAIAVAALMPDPIEQVPDGMDQLIRLEKAWPAFDLLETAKRVDEQFERAGSGLSHPFSFLKRCRQSLASAC